MVMISTKGRYALRVMADLASHQGEGYVPLKEIAERQQISEKYLESVLKGLVRQKMLVGVRGKGGGYRLTLPAREYTLGCILRMTEGELAPVACLESTADPCPRQGTCATLPIWQKLNTLIQDFFDGITLADLIENGPVEK